MQTIRQIRRNKRAVHFFACLSKENVIFAIEIIQLPQAQVC